MSLQGSHRPWAIRFVATELLTLCNLVAQVSSTLLYYISQVIWVSKYRNIDDRHKNPNINIKEIIWLGNQLPFH